MQAMRVQAALCGHWQAAAAKVARARVLRGDDLAGNAQGTGVGAALAGRRPQ